MSWVSCSGSRRVARPERRPKFPCRPLPVGLRRRSPKARRTWRDFCVLRRSPPQVPLPTDDERGVSEAFHVLLPLTSSMVVRNSFLHRGLNRVLNFLLCQKSPSRRRYSFVGSCRPTVGAGDSIVLETFLLLVLSVFGRLTLRFKVGKDSPGNRGPLGGRRVSPDLHGPLVPGLVGLWTVL